MKGKLAHIIAVCVLYIIAVGMAYPLFLVIFQLLGFLVDQSVQSTLYYWPLVTQYFSKAQLFSIVLEDWWSSMPLFAGLLFVFFLVPGLVSLPVGAYSWVMRFIVLIAANAFVITQVGKQTPIIMGVTLFLMALWLLEFTVAQMILRAQLFNTQQPPSASLQNVLEARSINDPAQKKLDTTAASLTAENVPNS
ncbi:hypothetical protein [Marinibactrum halimedae]|uniref:Transmembrane protein n=1 Tax=Marinibactrum halimedae TaxID=1444977 RepID=A0AA37WMZ3_9GAMM|nr:hypothetical protein [Marinibactrum halimedae]MCD9460330.1 hypothetical protein [Marinibactrum halimedae]GLS26765.1 hypothetical protein GCM10007877_24840 [Marinibactrum halimedae]